MRELFGIDLRSLALFRMLLGAFLVLDLALRARDMEAFYTDFGVLPAQALPMAWDGARVLCFHQYFTSVPGVALLFLINAVFAVMLMVGYRTRIATFLCLLFVNSLQARNPAVLQGGDILLRVLVFWALFLPLGAYLSLDCRRHRPQPPGTDPRVLSAGTVAILLQVCFVYVFTALLKSHPSWRSDGDAVYLALQLDGFARPLGEFLRPYHGFLRLATHGTLLFEAFGTLFAFYPVRNGPVRTAVVFAFWFFHLVALNLCMDVGHFPYVCAIAWTVFLPPWFWEKTGAAWRKLPESALRRRAEAAVAANLPRGSLPPYSTRLAWPLQVVAAFFLVYVLIWNARSLDYKRWVRVFPRSLNFIGEVPHVDQYWAMFAPKPMTDDGWFVIPGKLRGGGEVDLWEYGAPVSWEKPESVLRAYRSDRWRKYMTNLLDIRNARYRLHFGRYLANQWNRDHYDDEEVTTFEICYMREDSQHGFKPPLPPRKVVMWRHWCFPEFAPKVNETAPLTGPTVDIYYPRPGEKPKPAPAASARPPAAASTGGTPDKDKRTEP